MHSALPVQRLSGAFRSLAARGRAAPLPALPPAHPTSPSMPKGPTVGHSKFSAKATYLVMGSCLGKKQAGFPLAKSDLEKQVLGVGEEKVLENPLTAFVWNF